MMGVYKLPENWKNNPRNMVQMVLPVINSTMVKVTFLTVDGNKTDLTGT